MDRCDGCPRDHHCVPGNGPLDSDILFLGEGPGWDEDREREPFCGRTGQEVNRGYMPLAGLRRPFYRFDNAMKCMPKGKNGKLDPKRQADRDMVQKCAETHLYPLIQQQAPKLIVPMGQFACRTIDPDINLELQHGIPCGTPWGRAFPMYHPAGGLHEPKKMLMLRTDWIRLGRYLKGKLPLYKDEYAGREDYKVITVPAETEDYLAGYEDSPLACDTETTRQSNPFCLTFSTVLGSGRLIEASNDACVRQFQNILDRWRGPILWHNWLFDGEVVRKMGLRFPRRLIVDTMVKVFHLGNLPQGLKALAYRELGMRMQDFDDLVTPHAVPLVLAYYREAFAKSWPKPEPHLERDSKTGKWKLKQPHSLTTKLKTFFTYYAKNPEKDVFEAWDNWEDSHQMIQEEMGRPWPGKCITYAWEADREGTIRYACRDADSLLRLWPVIKQMESRVRKFPQESWRVA